MNKRNCIIVVVAIVVLIIFIVVIGNGIYQNRKLFRAIDNNDYFGVETAIKKGAWVNTRKNLLYMPNIVTTNPTPLILACKNGNERIIGLLLDSGANINKKDNYTGQTPLLAALHGKKKNRFSLAMHLIEKGADISCVQSATSPFEETLVVLSTDDAQTISEGFELFKYLIQQQVSMEICTGNENALTFATHYNNYNVVKYLIEESYFGVDSYDLAGDTALIVAVKNSRVQIVELLLKLGADKLLTDSKKKTAIDYAKESNNEELILLLSPFEN